MAPGFCPAGRRPNGPEQKHLPHPCECWPGIPGARCIQHWAPQSPGPTHSSDHFSPVRRLKGDGFCGRLDVAIPEKGASGPELLLWVNPSLSPKSPFSGPGPWPSAEWTCDQPPGGCPQREGQGEEGQDIVQGQLGGCLSFLR